MCFTKSSPYFNISFEPIITHKRRKLNPELQGFEERLSRKHYVGFAPCGKILAAFNKNTVNFFYLRRQGKTLFVLFSIL